jgi:hypothetical protein
MRVQLVFVALVVVSTPVLGQGQTPIGAERPPVPALPHLTRDSTFTVERPGVSRADVLYYRNIVGIIFDDTTSGARIRNLLTRYRGTIIGGAPGDGEYFVRIPDPGPTFAAVNAIVTKLNAESGVALARKVYYRWKPIVDGLVPRQEDSDGSGGVVGVVLDSVSRAPVSNAQVFLQVGSRSMKGSALDLTAVVQGALSDEGGRFTFEAVRPGAYTLVVRMISYRTRNTPVQVSSGSGKDVVITLAPVPCPDRVFDCP